MIRFSVNLNKVALVRNSRDPDGVPNLREMASICLENGANGITLHPRPDRRHALPEDAEQLAEWLRELVAELNLEGNPFSQPEERYPGFVELVRQVRPNQCTLVPDRRDQLTSDHGWPLDEDNPSLHRVIEEFKQQGCRVSLFIDPVPRLAARAAAMGADCIELYTGPWAKAWNEVLISTDESAHQRASTLHRQYLDTAKAAVDAGMAVHAGHDLNQKNLDTIARLPGLAEVSIGQALITDALHLGLGAAVRQYVDILRAADSSAGLPLDLPI